MNRSLKSASKILPVFAFLFVFVVFDQISKLAASKYLYVWCNQGSVFGFGSARGSNLIISLTSLVILLYFIYLVFAQENYRKNAALMLVLSGGASNLLDRLVYGCVRDFIRIFYWFPSFNLADIFISAGVLIFVFSTIKKIKK